MRKCVQKGWSDYAIKIVFLSSYKKTLALVTYRKKILLTFDQHGIAFFHANTIRVAAQKHGLHRFVKHFSLSWWKIAAAFWLRLVRSQPVSSFTIFDIIFLPIIKAFSMISLSRACFNFKGSWLVYKMNVIAIERRILARVASPFLKSYQNQSSFSAK